MKCPYCGSEMFRCHPSDMCTNPKCEFYQVPVPVEYVETLHKYILALEKYKTAIDAAKRFAYGVREKQIELSKSTSSSHLLLFQLPCMASLCLTTIDELVDKAESILKS